MRRLIASLLVFLALQGVARAQVQYKILGETQQDATSKEDARPTIEGDSFFSVNTLPLPSQTIVADQCADAGGGTLHCYHSIIQSPFSSVLLRTGTNRFAFSDRNSSGDDTGVHARH